MIGGYPGVGPEGLRAGLRSADWAASPNTRTANVWHIAVLGHAACNSTMPLMGTSQQPAAGVLSDVRCKSKGCARWWQLVPDRRYGDTIPKS